MSFFITYKEIPWQMVIFIIGVHCYIWKFMLSPW